MDAGSRAIGEFLHREGKKKEVSISARLAGYIGRIQFKPLSSPLSEPQKIIAKHQQEVGKYGPTIGPSTSQLAVRNFFCHAGTYLLLFDPLSSPLSSPLPSPLSSSLHSPLSGPLFSV